MVLKPKATPFALALLGGLLFVSFPLLFQAFIPDSQSVTVPMMVVGGVLSLIGVHMLLTRNARVVIIDSSGITIHRPKEYLRLPAEEITLVFEFSSPVKPAVEITLVGGEVIHFDCRDYCNPSLFIKHCRDAGIPCA